ncbi:39S ribosomal protein L35, mitochondrial [Elysia marginata]|uniref:Large ribosomal subunit protein bL35m n=1 Tax=Elysia marginata TaxID=1093978 RepID=A0AAV4HIX4_9GAST|nr:39S ribosomal protein L35, mitochondrial [Elysia marginata]
MSSNKAYRSATKRRKQRERGCIIGTRRKPTTQCYTGQGLAYSPPVTVTVTGSHLVDHSMGGRGVGNLRHLICSSMPHRSLPTFYPLSPHSCPQVLPFTQLCTQARNAVRSSNVSEVLHRKDVHQLSRSFSALKMKACDPQNNDRLSKCSFHTSPMSLTTPELKEWREHRVIDRFYRLPWGAWIRTQGGRKKGLYKKVPRHRWQLQQHIFCNYHQNKLLDKLVTSKWKEPKYFVDSPYEPYHQRTNSYWQPNRKKFYP